MRRVFVLVPLIALLSVEVSRAQTVSGTVTNSVSGRPLRSVNVRIKGTNQWMVTKSAGRYTLSVPSLQDTLVFSLIGYEPQEVPIAGRTEIDVQLVVLPVELEAQIVTGYRVQDRATVTGSVTSVNSAQFADVPVDNLSNALAGRLSGATITRNAGTPGRESSIRIRAVGTFNNDDPLYVIDGVVSDQFAFDGLSTDEVESISVLKDGAAASVYGSRAANVRDTVDLESRYDEFFGHEVIELDTQFDINWRPNYYFYAIPPDHITLNKRLEQTMGWAGGTFDPLL